jgi:NAD-dependent dihydropyrimidine dehydrogenase PreA subunit
VIEVVSDARCIDCNLCVKVCPTNVFDSVPGDHPVIARQGDCQTCFLCEAYCPVDALFVSPATDPLPAGSNLLDETWLIGAGLLGRYRHDLGWNNGATPTARRDPSGKLSQAMHGDPGPTRLPLPGPYRPLVTAT